MAYQRFQFAHDHYGITLGGGQLNNPGRYLTLLPPINGAGAITGSPYFTGNPGDKYHAYDATATFDYMPSQWLTFRSGNGLSPLGRAVLVRPKWDHASRRKYRIARPLRLYQWDIVGG